MKKTLFLPLLAALLIIFLTAAGQLEAGDTNFAERVRQSGNTVSERLEETRQMLDELESMLRRCREIARRLEKLGRDLEALQRRLDQLEHRTEELEQKISRFKSLLD